MCYHPFVNCRGLESSRLALLGRSIPSYTSQASKQTIFWIIVLSIIYSTVCSVGRPKHVRLMAGGLEGDMFIGTKAEVCNLNRKICSLCNFNQSWIHKCTCYRLLCILSCFIIEAQI